MNDNLKQLRESVLAAINALGVTTHIYLSALREELMNVNNLLPDVTVEGDFLRTRRNICTLRRLKKILRLGMASIPPSEMAFTVAVHAVFDALELSLSKDSSDDTVIEEFIEEVHPLVEEETLPTITEEELEEYHKFKNRDPLLTGEESEAEEAAVKADGWDRTAANLRNDDTEQYDTDCGLINLDGGATTTSFVYDELEDGASETDVINFAPTQVAYPTTRTSRGKRSDKWRSYHGVTPYVKPVPKVVTADDVVSTALPHVGPDAPAETYNIIADRKYSGKVFAKHPIRTDYLYLGHHGMFSAKDDPTYVFTIKDGMSYRVVIALEPLVMSFIESRIDYTFSMSKLKRIFSTVSLDTAYTGKLLHHVQAYSGARYHCVDTRLIRSILGLLASFVADSLHTSAEFMQHQEKLVQDVTRIREHVSPNVTMLREKSWWNRTILLDQLGEVFIPIETLNHLVMEDWSVSGDQKEVAESAEIPYMHIERVGLVVRMEDLPNVAEVSKRMGENIKMGVTAFHEALTYGYRDWAKSDYDPAGVDMSVSTLLHNITKGDSGRESVSTQGSSGLRILCRSILNIVQYDASTGMYVVPTAATTIHVLSSDEEGGITSTAVFTEHTLSAEIHNYLCSNGLMREAEMEIIDSSNAPRWRDAITKQRNKLKRWGIVLSKEHSQGLIQKYGSCWVLPPNAVKSLRHVLTRDLIIY